MTPLATILSWLLLCAVCALVLPTAPQEIYGSPEKLQAALDNSSCPEALTVRDVRPQTCCTSFLSLHNVIIECLAKPLSSTSCIGHCLLQNFRAQKILVNSMLTLSSLITVGPKLSAHYEQCQNMLFEFVVGNTFDGDFRRIVCDERLERFFECMVKSWLQDCMGYDDSNARCVELQKVVKGSTCSMRSFFTHSVTTK
ncbi:uncharacterized protein LOC126561156 [Anopheles maculipalpis]|uniref:uncharacterized protein LOC126561156 n=1 Tax=Anopheles maculipalpis TaxID=1496333 RepID=UPI0021594BDC|nr:uncharacterized protein LOC126561156 [Anopheles maculipalpis]